MLWLCVPSRSASPSSAPLAVVFLLALPIDYVADQTAEPGQHLAMRFAAITTAEPLVSVGDDNAQMVGGNARMVVECAGIGARHRRRGLAGEHDNVPVRSDCRPRETGDHVPYNANACKGVSEVCDE